MMKRFLLGTVAAILTGVSANAADLPVATEAPAVAPVTAYDWTGFYLGGHVGYGWGNTDWNYVGGGTASHDTDGFLAGVQAGYNHQFDSLVAGIEADIAWSDIDGSTACPNPVFSCQSEIEYLGSVRARLGYAADNFLLYATGGLGYGGVNIRTRSPGVGGGSSETRFGWTAGGGIEYGLTPNWSAKAEYLYYDLGEDRYAVDGGILVNADLDVHTVKVGVNYKFGWGGNSATSGY